MNFYLVFTIIVSLSFIIAGRLFCGRLCPLGILQDLIFKIPFFKKIGTFKYDMHLRFAKYIFLLANRLLIPALVFFGLYFTDRPGISIPTLIAIALLLMAIIIKRPLCKYRCTTGAIGALINRISLHKYNVIAGKCNQCDNCTKVCKVDIIPYKLEKGIEMHECIRCGKCIKACPKNAITSGFRKSVPRTAV